MCRAHHTTRESGAWLKRRRMRRSSRFGAGRKTARPPGVTSGQQRFVDARGAFALVFEQLALADADVLWRHFDEFIVGDELDRVFEREIDRRREDQRVVLAGGADV